MRFINRCCGANMQDGQRVCSGAHLDEDKGIGKFLFMVNHLRYLNTIDFFLGIVFSEIAKKVTT